ncbi:hypothetical protein [Nocardioides rubriscoriae]|uniref:hypothetical protein n=1 Tax=Nocardioides rubriscoriae TaxID=642762 RepID=UPI0011DF51C9|nr:hypothetical protein [Nocardioides rubriscoriae]
MPDHTHDAKPGDDKDPKTVIVQIGDKSVTTPKQTTPRALLTAAGLDPDRRRLVGITGKAQHPYPDLDEKLTVHDGQVFITVSIGPTPVS